MKEMPQQFFTPESPNKGLRERVVNALKRMAADFSTLVITDALDPRPDNLEKFRSNVLKNVPSALRGKIERSFNVQPLPRTLKRSAVLAGAMALFLSVESVWADTSDGETQDQTTSESKEESKRQDRSKATINAFSQDILDLVEEHQDDRGIYWYRFNCAPNENVKTRTEKGVNFLYVNCEDRVVFDATCSSNFTPDFYAKYPDQPDDGIKGINKGMETKSRIIFWCKPIDPDIEKKHLPPPEDGLPIIKKYF